MGKEHIASAMSFVLVAGMRYSEDTFETNVTNFFNVETFTEKGTSDETLER